ncbi:SRPBCC family protein [Acidimicrobiia bacterium EGI L10123]|uniref:SRPBCC family protein n=1 Tax=Salinilacustrithrix flava TaxID=2957203 RepID=UPI003D7C297B|nr:SRPBCC family protein [Acidimicrobiia bacterium EGI L10123]
MLWVERSIDATPAAAWELLTDTDRWPDWGPSITEAKLDGDRFLEGSTGWVRTAVGVRLPFRITDFEEGVRWSWSVVGIPATSHRIRPDGSGCRVGFGVPVVAAPYLVVCRIALARIEDLLH